MIRRPPRSTPKPSSAASDVYKRQAEELESEGNYYKVLKRLFSIYVLESNQNKLQYLTSVFNSPLGASYERICNMKAMELLYQNYNDKRTLQQINQNIKLLGDNFRITSISRYIHKYQKELNATALKHLEELRNV